MISLIYVSAAVEEFEPSELGALLNQSRQNNARVGVTGLLIYVGGNFLQLLEGDLASVQATYQRIARDPRHRSLIKLYEKPTGDRQFGRWSMALANPASLGPACETESLSVIRQALANEMGQRLDEQVRILLGSFANTMR